MAVTKGGLKINALYKTGGIGMAYGGEMRMAHRGGDKFDCPSFRRIVL
jgi:hypothetical protein